MSSPEPHESLRGADEARAARMAARIAAAGRKAELLPPVRSQRRIVRLVDYTSEALGALILASILLLLFANATGRYLLNRPIGWTQEVATGLVVWLAVVGVFISVRRRDLIVVRVIVGRLSGRLQRRVHALMTFVGVGALGYLGWYAWEYTETFGSDTTPYLGLPQATFFLAIPIGAVAIGLALLANMLRPPDPLEDELSALNTAQNSDHPAAVRDGQDGQEESG
ncbi:MAG: TRAP transporter small permease subunit [Nitriliruptorales bacterium]|nr:TRAP transporter small permease subunit [Nitriliruptorales bacterium]